GQTLQATALVHEAYLRLVTPSKSPPSQGGEEKGVQWKSRGHFFAAAAEAMRRILVENARHKRRVRHGGGRRRIDLSRLDVRKEDAADDFLALDEALERLAADDKAVADVVKLRYFAGLTAAQAAAALGISLRTANRHWAYARAWLYQQLSGPSNPG